MYYVPISLPFFLALWFLFAVLVVLIEIGVLNIAFESMGVDRRYVFTFLILSLLGSYINIPVAAFPAEQVHSGEIVDYYGVRYVIPVVINWPRTVIAVNLGGAVIPFVLSVYLILKNRQYLRTALAIGIVTWAVHAMARTVPGVGVVVAIFIPPLITAFVAVAISRRHAAPLAYISGSLGTLIGADLLNLGKIRGLGAPVASIGGAGKFDGIFLTGLIAVLLATILDGRGLAPRPDERDRTAGP